jgi:plasmid stabilization system protein ParE
VAEFNPDAADRQTDRFQSLFAKLAEMPGIGVPRYDLVEGMRIGVSVDICSITRSVPTI